MQHFLRDLMHYAERMGPQHWLYVLLAAVVIGSLCLRGYGSRSNY